MKAYIFGAGASCNYKESNTRVKPPLAKDFFTAFHNLEIAEDRYVLIGHIVNYIKKTRGVDAFEFITWNENIEAFLTEIDELVNDKEKFSKLPIEEKFLFTSAYAQMIFLFTSVLNEIQNGEVCKDYARFTKKLREEDVLITFNWDCLLDRAMSERGDWFVYDGYGITFNNYFDNGWITNPNNFKSRNLLLKLHGSTNWLLPYSFRNLVTGNVEFVNRRISTESCPIFCFVQSDDIYNTYEGRSKVGYAPFSYYYYPPDIPIESDWGFNEYTRIATISAIDLDVNGKTTIGGYPYSSMPCIVPPVKQKEYSSLGNVFDKLWDSALETLVKCDELIIIGYSFPETDRRSWELLKTACKQRETPLKIILVNPYPEQLEECIKKEELENYKLNILKMTFSEYAKRNPYYEDATTACQSAVTELKHYPYLNKLINENNDILDQWISECARFENGVHHVFGGKYEFTILTICGLSAYSRNIHWRSGSLAHHKILERIELCLSKLHTQKNYISFKNKISSSTRIVDVLSELVLAELYFDNGYSLEFEYKYQIKTKLKSIERDVDFKATKNDELFYVEVYNTHDVDDNEGVMFYSDDIDNNSIFSKVKSKLWKKFVKEKNSKSTLDPHGKVILGVNINYHDALRREFYGLLWKENLEVFKEKMTDLKSKFPFIENIIFYELSGDDASKPISITVIEN